ncbi:MAG: DUF4476 domain-containing protein [Ginsengibacter sp.]
MVTSSSAAGYLILPKLAEGDHDITVGFPKREFPEEQFHVSVGNENEGFLLKNFDDKGWGLFNLQSFAIVMGNSTNGQSAPSRELENDPFSQMLANVVKDSTLLEKNTIVPDEKEKVAINDSVTKEAVPTLTSADKRDITGNDVKPLAKKDSSKINRTLLNENNNGVEMIYVDNTPPGSDTIRVFIPSQTEAEIKKEQELAIAEKEQKVDVVAVESAPAANLVSADSSLPSAKAEKSTKPTAEKVNKEQVAEEVVPVQKNSQLVQSGIHEKEKSTVVSDEPLNVIENTTTEPKIKDTDVTKDHPKVVTSSFTNSDCSDFATDDDFIKLRKKMAGEMNKEDMIRAAKKLLQSKCFSTEQIKNLSFLFANDQGKYEFFTAAYPFTSDSNLYSTLQSQLRDPYYVNRFKAMLHK